MTIPAAVLDHAQAHIELGVRSCLTCMHFKTQARGFWLTCELRPRIKEPSSRFDESRAELCMRRPAKCKLWEGEDE